MDSSNDQHSVLSLSSAPTSLFSSQQDSDPAQPTNLAVDGRGPVREGWEYFPWQKFRGYHVTESKQRSGWTWEHAYDIEDVEGRTRWVCMYCVHKKAHKPASFAAAGTDNQARHLVTEHKIEDPTGKRHVKRAKISVAQRLGLDTNRPSEQAIVNRLVTSFNPAYFQQLLTDWVSSDNIPFRKLESERFRRVLSYLNPAVTSTGSLPTHSTVRKWLLDEFNRHKGIVAELLQSSPGLIHLAFDGWTSCNHLSLLGINVFFLTSSGTLRKFLVGLPHAEGRHTGDSLAEEVAQIITEWGIGGQLGYFVTDNASNNDTCMEALAEEFGFNHKHRRLRCIGHIINLVVRQILFGKEADALENDCAQPKELLAELLLWRKKGPIGKLHNIVHWIQRSNLVYQRLHQLQRNEQALTGENGPTYEVIEDNATRWNSTSAMIERAIKLQSVIDALVLHEVQEWDKYVKLRTANRTQPMPAKTKNKPAIVDDYLTSDDWATLAEYHSILKPFHEVTIRLQANPTSGRFGGLWEVLPCVEYLLNKLEEVKIRTDQYPDSHFKVNINLGWAKLDEYYQLLDDTPAYVAACALHPAYRWEWIEDQWAFKKSWIKKAKAAVLKLWKDEYQSITIAEDPQLPQKRKRERLSEFDSWLAASRRTKHLDLTDDEYTYWQLDTSPTDDAVTNPVDYWILRRQQYPCLSRMALDLFSIPAMSAEVERIFNLAGQMVTPLRNRLEANTIAVGQILRSWNAEGIIERS